MSEQPPAAAPPPKRGRGRPRSLHPKPRVSGPSGKRVQADEEDMAEQRELRDRAMARLRLILPDVAPVPASVPLLARHAAKRVTATTLDSVLRSPRVRWSSVVVEDLMDFLEQPLPNAGLRLIERWHNALSPQDQAAPELEEAREALVRLAKARHDLSVSTERVRAAHPHAIDALTALIAALDRMPEGER